MNEPRPELTLPVDGNAFALMGRVKGALKSAGASKEHIKNFMVEATSGGYEDLLRTCSRYVEIK